MSPEPLSLFAAPCQRCQGRGWLRAYEMDGTPNDVDCPDCQGKVDPTRVRRDDRATSVGGAVAASYRAGTQKARLLDAYYWAGSAGLTDEEAAVSAGLSLTTCYWKRCGELRAHGLVEETGLTREGSAGVARIVSVITDAGRAVARKEAS